MAVRFARPLRTVGGVPVIVESTLRGNPSTPSASLHSGPDEDVSRVREAYGDDIYQRLADVKAKYDPETSSTTTRRSTRARPRAGTLACAVAGGSAIASLELRCRAAWPIDENTAVEISRPALSPGCRVGPRRQRSALGSHCSRARLSHVRTPRSGTGRPSRPAARGGCTDGQRSECPGTRS